ncbi:MAG: ABC-F family ATP-binding cassette domain-containing protein [Pseudomonadota bacterium]
MSLAFSLKNISKAYGDDTLFQDLTIDFKFNEQLGVIGTNGSGKSTLLKIIAGNTLPDYGERLVKKTTSFVYLEQEDRLDSDLSVEELLYNTLEGTTFNEKERHKIVQTALGKGEFENPDTLCKNLSGGWKKKLAITRALCTQPDILLLDEPTNHLDINGILWLENLLKTAQFSFILVSHDRTFLDNVCQNIMEIGRYYPSGFFKIPGTYTKFNREREKFLTAQQKKQESLSNKMRREDEWLKQGAKARTTKAKYRIDQAYELRSQVGAIKERNRSTATVDIDFHATGRQTKKLLRAWQIGKTIDKKLLFENITFEIGPKFCLGIVGPNGSGKSTFLSILEQKTEPDHGTIEWAQDLKILVFDQTRSTLNPNHTLKEALNPAGGDSVNYKDRSIHIVSWAKRFLFMTDQLDMPVNRLSGGEKARIMLANIMLSPCDVLLLDEPTNDLDILSLEVLEQSIQQFPGAVIIVSHDRYLMNRVCHKMLFLDPGKDAQFFKNFEQILAYRKQSLIQKTKSIPVKKSPKKQIKNSFSFKDKYELDHIEENILAAENEVALLSEKIQDPQILNKRDEMDLYCSKLKIAQETVHTLYERWEVLEQKKTDADQN